MSSAPKRRVLLKLSGELFCRPGSFGVEPDVVLDLARNLSRGLARGGVELAIVVGGGNFLRGQEFATKGIGRVSADNMGMLATVLNALALQSGLEQLGVETRVQSAFEVRDVAEPFIRRRALKHLARGRVLILAGGTGSPYFTTDTTAALRALQLEASLLAKGTKVRGIYSADPVKHPDAVFYERLSFQEVLERRLRIMDMTAISLCMENALPILVFDLRTAENLDRLLRGETPGTLVE